VFPILFPVRFLSFSDELLVELGSLFTKLIRVSLLDKTPALMAANMQALEQIFRGIIQRHTRDDNPPPEVLHMLNHIT
jgi:hypothetical protein